MNHTIKSMLHDTPNGNMQTEKFRIIILGSCVTRDIFRVDRIGVEIVDYFARTSIKSLTSPRLDVDPMEIILDSDFQKRMVLRDFLKEFWSVIEENGFDFLLIDFIDERFNIFYYNNSVITKSNELIQSGFTDKYKRELIERKRKDITPSEMFVDMDRFVTRLSSIVPPSKVILVKAFWAEEYFDKQGNRRYFDKNTKFTIDHIKEANALLNDYYKQFVQLMPRCNIVDTIEPIADINHVWGLSPFHYQEYWYRDTRAKINQVTKIAPSAIDD